MRPTQLLLTGLLAVTCSTVWAADGSERSQQARTAFLASQEQIHGESGRETETATTDAPSTPSKAGEDI
ncbi:MULTISPECIES: hypothetical protein [Pseudomonas]|uniref:Secreted protein n=1 Tax=Pseudomonas sessilinigenes TaxID=658629 RepID=A0ABX8MM93_9PSED|nr:MULTISPECIES: hypothetical protein [Pseudomonas]AZC26083.1 hypothetical protein C4K39_4434 [Pseudomonas sessilinigenes]QIH10822.1 hypothetical protein ATY02_30835 [Pseudomonas sp. BIOMIG1BAC]QXH39887.1 hypothetical protein KSS89_27300 [Pseudomonas sessilinigenes]